MKVIVIGSGLGGLECAWGLSRAGHEVTVLEQGRQAGGCLQTFVREGHRFDTGFHYAGGLGEGEPLHRVFSRFGLTELPWKQVNPACAETLVFEDGTFRLPSGIDNYVRALSERFPADRAGLEAYGALLKTVGDRIPEVSLSGENPLLGIQAAAWLEARIQDPLLRKILAGSPMRLWQDAATLPLYAFAQINGSFVRSVWKLPGGGKAITDKLTSEIRSFGGNIHTGTAATGIRITDGRATAVEAGEALFPADIVISDAHPAVTMGLIKGNGIRGIYRRRITSLPSTPGMFTAHILLKDAAPALPEGNLHVHAPGSDPWQPDASRTDTVLIHTYPDAPGQLDLLAWMDSPQRNAAYAARKEKKLEECLSLAETALPGLRAAIRKVWTDTPRSWEDYTSAPGGTAFGIVKDARSPLTTFLSPRTAVGNLFLTGSGPGLHGLLGVSMTALMTLQAIEANGEGV